MSWATFYEYRETHTVEIAGTSYPMWEGTTLTPNQPFDPAATTCDALGAISCATDGDCSGDARCLPTGHPDARPFDRVLYDCVEECTAADDCRTTHPADPSIEIIWFVVDGMAGWFRVRDDPAINDSLVYYQEGVGSCFRAAEGDYRFWEPTTPWEELENSGHGIISPWFLPGYVRQGGIPTIGFSCSGWMTQTDRLGGGWVRMAMRSAQLLRWAHDNVADGAGDSRPFGFIGHSNGAVAGFTAFHWGAGQGVDVDPLVDAWVLAGGPVMWDVRLLCGDDGDGAYLEGLSPMCEEDPSRTCEGELTEYAHHSNFGGLFTWMYDYLLDDPALPCSMAMRGSPIRTEPGRANMVRSSLRGIDSALQPPGDAEPRGPMIFLVGDDPQDEGPTGTGDVDGRAASHVGRAHLMIEGSEWHLFYDYNHFWDLTAPEDNSGEDGRGNDRFGQDDLIQQRVVDFITSALEE